MTQVTARLLSSAGRRQPAINYFGVLHFLLLALFTIVIAIALF